MQHVMRIQKPTKGDEEVTWDPADEASVKHAQEQFDLALKEGKRAYMFTTEGDQSKPGEEVKEFDPKLGSILLVGAQSGG